MLRAVRYQSPKYQERNFSFVTKSTLEMTATSKVKSRSHHDIAHIHSLTNVPTKYPLPTPYGFRDIVQTRFYRSRSLRQDQRSYQGHTMMLQTYTKGQINVTS